MSYVEDVVAGVEQDTKRAVAVYYAIRDGILYDPYSADISVAGLKATTVLEERRGWCVSKAILLAACCRALGIPARLGYADVLNHLSTEKMRQRMKTNVFYWHGYTALYLDDRWVKATPAFNIELCEKFGLKPLEFNGRDDSIYHAFDQAGNRHMEYLHDRGQFLEPPIEAMRRTFDECYPGWPDTSDATEADFGGEVADETATR
ncbi:MAG TPA: transglutaminase family protein [Gammaproteobacteria bacterium]|jgi:transglutaminase-like putative cysteine protease|nr:transglutaminase family protein [Arenicellales bacterium]HIG15670.1 transglutaminase family protein [Gammaproteobacteria bacterium]HIL18461.1 transglutaminase family protein [Gammaproteobacteria bacterium]